MDIERMHIAFRVLGQEIATQHIRTLLPETIDVFINNTINQEVRTVVAENTNMQFRDRVAVHRNPVSPINSIRTLYKTKPLVVPAKGSANDAFYTIVNDIDKVMYFTSFNVNYGVDGNKAARFIESDFVDETIRDYCNSPSWDYPIVSMFSDETDKEYIQLYIGKDVKLPELINVRYIETPNVVKWNENPASRVDCNLPDYTHDKIVEIAVSKYLQSVGVSSRRTPQN